MSARKLLFLVSEDWYFCSHRLPLAIAARDAGYHVTVATRVTNHGDTIKAQGLSLVPLSWSRRTTHPLLELRILRELIALYRRHRPDVVHHVAIKAALYGSIAARRSGVPRVVNAVSGLGYVFTSNDFKARILRPIVGAAMHLLLDNDRSRLIVQNQDDHNRFVRQKIVDHRRVVVIRGVGTDLGHFSVQPERDGEVLVVLPARMVKDKGVLEFVAAAEQLKRAGLNARFALVGAPDEENPSCIPESSLLAWQSKGLVEYWGWRDDMARVFQQSHIVCLPSYREGLPKALIEAAACGRAIVTTNVPGCREVVRDGDNGLLVPPRDSAALAQALKRLIEDQALRKTMGKQSRLRAESEFSAARANAQTLALYD